MKKLLMLVTGLLCALAGYATNIDGINYELYRPGHDDWDPNTDSWIWVPDGDTGTAYVTYFDSDNEFANNGEYYQGEITIPEHFVYEDVTYEVIGIRGQAFKNCHSLTSVVMPNTITSLGYESFRGCQNLESIQLSESLLTIDSYCFSECKGLTSVVIPNSVTTIGYEAFGYCSSLENITLSENLTSLSEWVFAYCGKLKEITIPDSVTAIGSYDFYECNALQSVTLGNAVKSIGNNAFSGCRSLKSINFPVSLTTIGEYAFNECHALAAVDFNEGLKNIGNNAFQCCYNLERINLSSSITRFGENVFWDCNNIKELNVPDLAKFCAMSGLGINSYETLKVKGVTVTDLVIPATVTKVGDGMFRGCKSLTSLTLHDGVTAIGNEAFSNCSNLATINWGKGITTIGNDAFNSCKALTELTIPATVTSLGSAAFCWCDNITSVNIEAPITAIKDNTFVGASSLTYLTLPSSIKSIGYQAFGGPVIDVVDIKDFASWCELDLNDESGLNFKQLNVNGQTVTTVTLAEGITKIRNGAFMGCSELTSVVIPSTVETIGYMAFANCSSLTSISIPKGVKSIGGNAFNNCGKLVSITLPDGIESIKYSTFSGCNSLVSVTIPNTVTTIEGYAFQNCTSLATIKLPDALKAINSYTFDGCVALSEIAIPASAKSIGDNAFDGCTSLRSLTFADGDEMIYIGHSNEIYYYDTWSENRYIGLFKDCPIENLYLGRNFDYHRTDQWGNESDVCLPFKNLSKIENIKVGDKVTQLPDLAFNYNYAEITFAATTPATLGNSSFSNDCLLRVPNAAYNDYVGAWEDYKTQIIGIDSPTKFNVTAQAKSVGSSVLDAVVKDGSDLQTLNVVELKVKGTINSYDIMVMRNKMLNLRYVDLSEADIVENDYEYYQGYSTQNNVVGTNFFSMLPHLRRVWLPNSAQTISSSALKDCPKLEFVTIGEGTKSIGYEAFQGNSHLTTVVCAGDSVEVIGGYAFRSCSNLKDFVFSKYLRRIESYAFQYCYGFEELNLPEHLTTIGEGAFNSCSSLKHVNFPPELATIGTEYGYEWGDYGAFQNCSNLEEAILPTKLHMIGGNTFEGCSKIKSVKIPESIHVIGDYAFNTSSITDIYTWTMVPTNINQNTFNNSLYTTATLHVPEQGEYGYYWDTQWSQFLTIRSFNEPYEYFYVPTCKDLTLYDGLRIDFNTNATREDLTLDDGLRIDFNTDATNEDAENIEVDIENRGGLIVEGEAGQQLGDVTIESDGNDSASIIGAESSSEASGANVNIDDLTIKISIEGNRWYFFAFPFDIDLSKIKFPGQFVWRYYDGEYRAINGSGAWQNMTETVLRAGKGYIFQANVSGSLEIHIGKASIGGDDKSIELEAYLSANVEDASWNLIGNPFTSYFGLSDISYNGPITTWNPWSQTYEAYNPMDDELSIHPFQAFFVQKPQGVESVDFDADFRVTYCQSNDENHRMAARQRRMMRAPARSERCLINLELTDGTSTDKTRVVFNPERSESYEMECDASKFISTTAPQIYTLDSRNVKYSINERPEGEGIVRIGLYAPAAGEYTISCTRIDTPMMLLDLETGLVTMLETESYTFDAAAGTNEDRFLLVRTGATSGIGSLTNGSDDALYFGVNGVAYGNNIDAAPAGILLKVSNGHVEKITKK